MKTVLRNRGKGSSRRKRVYLGPERRLRITKDRLAGPDFQGNTNLTDLFKEIGRPLPKNPTSNYIRAFLLKGKTTSLSCQAELCGLCETTGCRCDCHRG